MYVSIKIIFIFKILIQITRNFQKYSNMRKKIQFAKDHLAGILRPHRRTFF